MIIYPMLCLRYTSTSLMKLIPAPISFYEQLLSLFLAAFNADTDFLILLSQDAYCLPSPED